MAEYNNNNANKGTSTHIRTLYSEGLSYLTISFFNTNLSFKFVPFIGKDANGKNKYNEAKIIATTTNFEGAALLLQAANEVLTSTTPTDTMRAVVECNGGAKIVFERKLDQNNQMASWLTIEKNGEIVPFKFEARVIQMTKSGQPITKIVETGVIVLSQIIAGYLTGINADRHLNKLTEDYAKAQENKSADGAGGGAQGGSYQKNWNNNGGGYQKKWNNYKKPYNGGGGYQNNNSNNQGGWTPVNSNQDVPWGNNNNNNASAPAQSIGMSSYTIPQ